MEQLYRTWVNMKHRCHGRGKTDKVYRWYRDKGIIVCEEWREDFPAFRDWALSHGFEEGLTIDRIDSDGDYCPNNCRWVTRSENSRNKKPRSLKTTKEEWTPPLSLTEQEKSTLKNLANIIGQLSTEDQRVLLAYARGVVDGGHRQQQPPQPAEGQRPC